MRISLVIITGIALILLEQSERDTSYRDVLNRFTEVYKNEGGVF